MLPMGTTLVDCMKPLKMIEERMVSCITRLAPCEGSFASYVYDLYYCGLFDVHAAIYSTGLRIPEFTRTFQKDRSQHTREGERKR